LTGLQLKAKNVNLVAGFFAIALRRAFAFSSDSLGPGCGLVRGSG
jgi:hypothetical protein